MNKEEFEIFINLINDCSFENSDLSENNLFHILQIEQNEVLLCRLLGFLLTPNQMKEIGAKPLEGFLKKMGVNKYSYDQLLHAQVVLEKQIDENRRVDLVIYVGNDVYPVEVKVWARDQKSQLYDYYDYYRNSYWNIERIYYLTPYGNSPIHFSLSKGDQNLSTEQYKLLSFAFDVDSWIVDMQKAFCNDRGYCHLLDQFDEVIKNMCAEEKNIRKILDCLEINKVNGITSDPKVAALLKFMSLKQDDIWHRIREIYLDHALLMDPEYTLEFHNKEKGEHKICTIKHKEKEVAWICVDLNIYIVSEVQTQRIHQVTDQAYWAYLTPDGYSKNKRKFQLRNPNPEICQYNKIDLRPYLAEIMDRLSKN